MMYNKKYETISKQELAQLQLERLQSTLNRVYRNVSFYKQKFDKHKINIEKIKSIKDLKRLPFTTREDLRQSYPYDMFAVPLREIVRIHSTSGTTGKPIVVGYTKNDLHTWSECTARILHAAGITEHDVVQIAFNYNLFTGAFGFHQGAELIGASVIPTSYTTMYEKQIMIMKDFKTTTLICSPSYALNLGSALKESHIHPENLLLRTGLLGAEPWSKSLRNKIEESLHIIALDNYGLTEIIGPGVAGECEQRQGLHINEDHFIVEVINPHTGEILGPDKEGELVFTTITKEGFPLIRYRTSDISSLIKEPCACGRTLCRMERVKGRTDDLIFFSDFKIFPSQIEEVLMGIKEIEAHYQIILEREADQDMMEIKVEISEEIPYMDELKTLEHLRDKIIKRIDAVIGVKVKVVLAEPKSLRQVTAGKAKRVIDKREI